MFRGVQRLRQAPSPLGGKGSADDHTASPSTWILLDFLVHTRSSVRRDVTFFRVCNPLCHPLGPRPSSTVKERAAHDREKGTTARKVATHVRPPLSSNAMAPAADSVTFAGLKPRAATTTDVFIVVLMVILGVSSSSHLPSYHTPHPQRCQRCCAAHTIIATPSHINSPHCPRRPRCGPTCSLWWGVTFPGRLPTRCSSLF
jgi:hypothetical protein